MLLATGIEPPQYHRKNRASQDTSGFRSSFGKLQLLALGGPPRALRECRSAEQVPAVVRSRRSRSGPRVQVKPRRNETVLRLLGSRCGSVQGLARRLANGN